MAQLTHRELMLLQDNISMCQETAKYLQGCINLVTDPQLKNMCQQMAQEHKQDMQTLSRHITQGSLQ